MTLTWSVTPRPDDDLPTEDELEAALAAGLAHGGRPARRVDVIVVDDDVLADLHERFMGDATPTDVITFDLGDDELGESEVGEPIDAGPDGEVYVSLDMARRIAAERGVPLARELVLYVVHGALHLCGYDDQEDGERAAMRTAEAAVLGALGYPPDTAPHDR